jgi:hypothetical protein
VSDKEQIIITDMGDCLNVEGHCSGEFLMHAFCNLASHNAKELRSSGLTQLEIKLLLNKVLNYSLEQFFNDANLIRDAS